MLSKNVTHGQLRSQSVSSYINLNKPRIKPEEKDMFGHLKANKKLKYALNVPHWRSFLIAPWMKQQP